MSTRLRVSRGIGLGLAIALFAAGSRTASACLAEFRSFDWIVGHSALIFVGEVTRVEKLPAGRADEGEDGPGADPPTMATIRVKRVLHGEYSREEITLRSGPVAS